MTDSAAPSSSSLVEQRLSRLRRRHAADRLFRLYGISAIILTVLILILLLGSIVYGSLPAFSRTEIRLDVRVDTAVSSSESRGSYQKLVRGALHDLFPEVEGRREHRQLNRLISAGAGQTLRNALEDTPVTPGDTITVWVAASADVDTYVKGLVDSTVPEANRRLDDQSLDWVKKLQTDGRIQTVFNTAFFVNGDSREPEQAGIRGAVMGSLLMLLVTLLLAVPIGIPAAVWLEEFAPRNRWTDLLEVNISNLAAVPSIVFGLLGLAVFIGFFGLPRSTPLVGGMVLALMTLPVIIITTRAALRSVSPSIREAAFGVGASRLQAVLHHIAPAAMTGILTGVILGMAQALGETAPLLMVGMVAFIADTPSSIIEPATVMPVQIFLWADSPERAFTAKTNAAILCLLVFLIAMNGLAIFLRQRFERFGKIN
ncbi:MAG: phosphate ABC transporter permease PstA [Parvularculales bacterium]